MVNKTCRIPPYAAIGISEPYPIAVSMPTPPMLIHCCTAIAPWLWQHVPSETVGIAYPLLSVTYVGCGGDEAAEAAARTAARRSGRDAGAMFPGDQSSPPASVCGVCVVVCGGGGGAIYYVRLNHLFTGSTVELSVPGYPPLGLRFLSTPVFQRVQTHGPACGAVGGRLDRPA